MLPSRTDSVRRHDSYSNGIWWRARGLYRVNFIRFYERSRGYSTGHLFILHFGLCRAGYRVARVQTNSCDQSARDMPRKLTNLVTERSY